MSSFMTINYSLNYQHIVVVANFITNIGRIQTLRQESVKFLWSRDSSSKVSPLLKFSAYGLLFTHFPGVKSEFYHYFEFIVLNPHEKPHIGEK